MLGTTALGAPRYPRHGRRRALALMAMEDRNTNHKLRGHKVPCGPWESNTVNTTVDYTMGKLSTLPAI